ncbi:MAG TPA: TetR family transcriptional regulator [Solirubrobacteraceae bacterium]|nr:TetR family transcriptional regulator [Solirubrobacteraceae bacterium]
MSSSRSDHTANRRPLTRERILDVAIALIEHDGPEALSMRRLGAALGVEGMAIYHHFAGREDLLGAIAERLLEPLDDLEQRSDWREDCHDFATTLREVAVQRPATFRLVGMQPLGEVLLLPVERLLGTLVEAGFEPVTALAIYRATISYARGYALAEVTGFTVDAAGGSGLERLQALRPDAFPVLAGRAGELAELDPDRAFRLGLDALLRGLEGPEGAAR